MTVQLNSEEEEMDLKETLSVVIIYGVGENAKYAYETVTKKKLKVAGFCSKTSKKEDG